MLAIAADPNALTVAGKTTSLPANICSSPGSPFTVGNAAIIRKVPMSFRSRLLDEASAAPTMKATICQTSPLGSVYRSGLFST